MQHGIIMSEYDLFFQTLHKKFNAKLKMHIWTTAQLNYSKVKLLSRKHLGEKPLDRILPLLAVSEELTRFAGLHRFTMVLIILILFIAVKMRFCGCWRNARDLMIHNRNN